MNSIQDAQNMPSLAARLPIWPPRMAEHAIELSGTILARGRRSLIEFINSISYYASRYKLFLST